MTNDNSLKENTNCCCVALDTFVSFLRTNIYVEKSNKYSHQNQNNSTVDMYADDIDILQWQQAKHVVWCILVNKA